MNQSEILKHLEKIKFFTEYKIGQNKVMRWLKEWSKKGKWHFEKRPEQKNACFFWIEDKKL